MYKVGDKVIIKYHMNGTCTSRFCANMNEEMLILRGKVHIISHLNDNARGKEVYRLENSRWNWTECMLEPVKKTTKKTKLAMVKILCPTQNLWYLTEAKLFRMGHSWNSDPSIKSNHFMDGWKHYKQHSIIIAEYEYLYYESLLNLRYYSDNIIQAEKFIEKEKKTIIYI